MMDNDYAAEQLAALQARIHQAAKKVGRQAAEIQLIGAAKQQSSSKLKAFIEHGLEHVGENYLQEALNAKQALNNLPAIWHYIGKIQSNKTASIARHFDWVHSVDRFKIAQRLAAQSPAGKTLNILLQVDIDNEPSKGGIAVDEVPPMCAEIAKLSGINLRGLMVLPAARDCVETQRQPFQRTRELLLTLNQKLGLSMDTLSMGMSGDLEAAILEGSTMIRIGTDLFGARAG